MAKTIYNDPDLTPYQNLLEEKFALEKQVEALKDQICLLVMKAVITQSLYREMTGESRDQMMARTKKLIGLGHHIQGAGV